MFFAMLLALAPAEANLATCAPREPPATGRCCYGFPAPSALQGCFLNLPTEAFDEAFISGGLLTTEPRSPWVMATTCARSSRYCRRE